jgi:hypothetical protein
VKKIVFQFCEKKENEIEIKLCCNSELNTIESIAYQWQLISTAQTIQRFGQWSINQAFNHFVRTLPPCSPGHRAGPDSTVVSEVVSCANLSDF